MQIEINDPALGTINWTLPEKMAAHLQTVDPNLRKIALGWAQRQTEGFFIALLGSRGSERLAKNFEQTIHELVAETAVG